MSTNKTQQGNADNHQQNTKKGHWWTPTKPNKIMSMNTNRTQQGSVDDHQQSTKGGTKKHQLSKTRKECK